MTEAQKNFFKKDEIWTFINIQEFGKKVVGGVELTEFRAVMKWNDSEETMNREYFLTEDGKQTDLMEEEKSLIDFLTADGAYQIGAEDMTAKFFFNLLGLKKDDQVTIISNSGWDYVDASRKVPEKGLIIFAQIDDFSLAVFRDGKPLGSMYTSTRGALYQSGAFIVEGMKFYYAHNLAGIFGRSSNIDMWEEASSKMLSGSIAYEFLTGNKGDYIPLTKEELDEYFRSGQALENIKKMKEAELLAGSNNTEN